MLLGAGAAERPLVCARPAYWPPLVTSHVVAARRLSAGVPLRQQQPGQAAPPTFRIPGAAHAGGFDVRLAAGAGRGVHQRGVQQSTMTFSVISGGVEGMRQRGCSGGGKGLARKGGTGTACCCWTGCAAPFNAASAASGPAPRLAPACLGAKPYAKAGRMSTGWLLQG